MKLFLILAILVPPAVVLNGQTLSSEIDVKAIDKSIGPCTNFYQYACGTWIKNNPLPGDQSRWTRFNELSEHNQEIERTILEKAARKDTARTPLQQKIGDYYASCMDEAAIDRKSVEPLKPMLDSIEAIKSVDQLTGEIARLQSEGIRALFSLRVQPDEKNAAIYLASLAQGGTAMPDRDYYLKNDPQTAEIRKQYREHVRKMFELLDAAMGRPADDAAKMADVVLTIETELAKNSLDRVAMRNPDNTYHRMTVRQLTGLTPDFGWHDYFSNMGAGSIDSLNVAEPEFFRGLAAIISGSSLADLKTYLTWHALNDSLNVFDGRSAIPAGVLPKSFEDENWRFNSHILNGVREPEPRWKTCVKSTDVLLGEALGQEFVKVAFSAASKEKTLEMVGEIEAEMAKVIQSASWMSAATKDQASTKLHEVANKIGYPEKWRDYSGVKIVPGDAFGNARRAVAFNIEYRLKKLGKPVDKSEWNMTPPTVNAYYSPNENNINFPAGILQPPFYSAKGSDAANYGGIGAVIGHELTHGFDDQGRRYDGRGNLRDWWTPEDGEGFR